MWLSDLRIVLPDREIARGALHLREGRIAAIVEGAGPAEAIRLPGLRAFPGIIDLHGDMLERELHPRPGANIPPDLALFELDKKLAANGITTAYAAISFAWHKDDVFRSEDLARELMALVNERRPHLLTDHYVHARFEITNPEAGDVLHDTVNKGHVHLVSVMDHTPGQGQYRNIEAYVQFSVQWTRDKLGRDVTEEDVYAYIESAQERPKAWDAVRSIARVAPQHGLALASHDDDTPQKIDFMHSLGFTISEFPVSLAAGQRAKELGFHVVMGAPNALRGASHSGNLSAGEAVAAGIVDTLATDYYPPAMLHAVYALEQRGVLPAREGIKLVAGNPADALGLHDRGVIAEGKRADLCLVDERLRPRVRATFRAGVPIYLDDCFARHSGLHAAAPTAGLAEAGA